MTAPHSLPALVAEQRRLAKQVEELRFAVTCERSYYAQLQKQSAQQAGLITQQIDALACLERENAMLRARLDECQRAAAVA